MSKSKKLKTKNITTFSRQGIMAISLVFVMAFSIISFSIVKADQYDAKIRELENQNNQRKAQQVQLGSEASGLNEAIGKLQADIDSKQAAINQHQQDVERLKKEIIAAEKELEKQKGLLSQTIRAIYVEGDISMVEMLASSDDLSDFFDKQQYRENVRAKVKTTLDKVNQLKLDLSTKKDKTEKLIKEQEALRNELVAQRGEKDRLLSLNKNEQAKLDAQIKENRNKIAKLRAEQLAANMRFINSGSVKILPGNNGNDTYPNVWRNAPQDSMVDNWGMYNRECVSYAAWKVYESGRFMPRWGGKYWGGYQGGNAEAWPHNARMDGIRVDSHPGSGNDGTVAVGTDPSRYGSIGHTMYVEQILGGGMIRVSQYNFGVAGQYSEMIISTAGLQFIHF